MAFKDLSAHLAPDLEIPLGGKVYRVSPPSKDVGLKLTAINAVGVALFHSMSAECPTCGRAGAPEVPAATRELYDSLGSVDLGELSLGDAYLEMVEDGVPGPHVDTAALYALYFWTMGEAVADAIMDAQAEAKGAPKAVTAPRRRSKSGRSGASGSRTKMASTPNIESQTI